MKGFFLETYQPKKYQEWGVDVSFIQDNHSFSKQGVLRGMHFQNNPPQEKLVWVVSGKIFDVIVDIREHSPSFGKWEGVMLDGQLREQHVSIQWPLRAFIVSLRDQQALPFQDLKLRSF